MSKFCCEVPNCKMRTYGITKEQKMLTSSKYIVSFHKFPPDIIRQKKWLEAIGRTEWSPGGNSVICSLHFLGSCYDRKNQLCNHAVPSIFFSSFEEHLNLILTAIERERRKNFSNSDDEDILTKSLKDVSPVVSDEEEKPITEISDSDDYEIECEEIILSDDDDAVPLSPAQAETKISEPPNESSKLTDLSVSSENKVNLNLRLSAPTSSTTPANAVPKLHTLSINEDTPERARQLYSMIQSGCFKNFSVMQPASKNLVCQLLEVVKLANTQNSGTNAREETVPNTYIVTTKYDDGKKKPVKVVETAEVINTISRTVQSMKDGTYERSEDLTIICGSPAIFLLKNVSVKNFDPNMNSVYVITSENILPYLYTLSTKPKQPRKILIKQPIEAAAPISQSSPASVIGVVAAPPPTVTQPQSVPCLSVSSYSGPNVVPSAVALPSNSSTLNAPKVVVAPLNVMRKNMVTALRKTNTIKQPAADSAAAAAATATIMIPAVNLGALSTAPALVSVPAALRTSLPVASNQNLVKLNFVPPTLVASVKNAASNVQTRPSVFVQPITASSLAAVNRSEPLKVNFKFETTPIKRKSLDASVLGSPAKRNLTTAVKVNVAPVPKISVRNLEKESTPFQWTLPLACNVNAVAEKIPDPPQARTKVDDEISAEEPLSPKSAQNLLTEQRAEIRNLEQTIIRKERQILSLRKKIPALRKRCTAVKNPTDSKSDEQLIEDILNKYLDNDAVQFFTGQMKCAGKTFTQYRWTEEDKLFALGLLYKNPTEYNVLFERFTLPSDKTLNKFVNRIKKAEMEAKK